MTQKTITMSAPATMMVLGEHAVLTGKTAVVAALDQRLSVTLQPRADHQIIIRSELGKYQTTIKTLAVEQPFQFILASLKAYQNQLPSGCEITVRSEFSSRVGLGSSAAVTVATLATLFEWLTLGDTDHLISAGIQVIREVQSIGSGADIAASVTGGVIGFQSDPLWIQSLLHDFPMTLIYVGYKKPTVNVVKQVQTFAKQHPDAWHKLSNTIHQCAKQGIRSIEQDDQQQLAQAMATQQRAMEALHLTDAHIRQLIAQLAAQPGVAAVKLSGSGLGDCVLALGELKSVSFLPQDIKNQGVKIINAHISKIGVRRE